jgi:membrane associated rhomboid family serine protease
VWAFGRDANHIGASGWIFGLWSLVIATAWFNRKFIHILIAIAVIIFQGGMVFGLIPGNPKISYEAHIFGAIAGVMCAAFNGRRG